MTHAEHELPTETGITRPVFLAGPGRSGTTLLLRLLALHPDLAWFSGWTNRFPRRPQLAVLSRANDLSSLEKASRSWRGWPRPAEAYGIWNYCFPGFSTAPEDWTEKKAVDSGAARLRRLILGHQQWQGKSRFLTKYTGWSRIRFIKALFPDACVVYIDRDPRAVVWSYLKLRWWMRDAPERLAAMSMPEKLDFYAGKFLAYYEVKQRFDPRMDYLQVQYERLVKEPHAVLEEICTEAGLRWVPAFAARVSSWHLYQDTNEAWRGNLDDAHRRRLTEALALPLREMGYGG